MATALEQCAVAWLPWHSCRRGHEKGQIDDQIADNTIGVLSAAQDTTASVESQIPP
ncbi:hypothetical protein WN943_001197 [Citrus x changshan-huyou]